jgi:hypothetical protein
MLLTPDELFLSGGEDANTVSTFGPPSWVELQVVALERAIAELNVADVITKRNGEVLIGKSLVLRPTPTMLFDPILAIVPFVVRGRSPTDVFTHHE